MIISMKQQDIIRAGYKNYNKIKIFLKHGGKEHENHFIWYLNLDGKSDTRLNVNIVGNKKNAIVSIDESGDISPLHTSDILYFNDEKSFTVETLHRPVLWMRSKKTERSKSVYSVTRIHLDMQMKTVMFRDTIFTLEKDLQKTFWEVKTMQNLLMQRQQVVQNICSLQKQM